MNIEFLDWGELLISWCLGKNRGTNGSRGGLKCVILRDIILKLKVFIQLGEPRGKAPPW